MELTVLDKIREEHELILDLLQSVDKAEGEFKISLFKDLQKELVRHLIAEEKSVYSRLKKDHEEGNDTQGGHHELKEFLQRLNLMNIRSESWNEMFQGLKKLIIRHCTEEEESLFKEMKEDYSREELIEINSEYQESGAAS
jgi:hemerythrin superfamily protein